MTCALVASQLHFILAGQALVAQSFDLLGLSLDELVVVGAEDNLIDQGGQNGAAEWALLPSPMAIIREGPTPALLGILHEEPKKARKNTRFYRMQFMLFNVTCNPLSTPREGAHVPGRQEAVGLQET